MRPKSLRAFICVFMASVMPVLLLAVMPVLPDSAAASVQLINDRSPSFPITGAWFGSTVNGAHYGIDDHEEALLYHEGVIERKLAFQRMYYAWDEEFPTDYEYWLKDNGQYVLLSWGARKLDDTYVKWRDIAAGVYDSVIDDRASGLKALGSPVFFIFNHEPENDGASGTSTEFTSAFQHVRNRFLSDGVTNVSFIWAMMAQAFRNGNDDLYYPGDSYVDAVGADGYNWYACPGRTDPWESFDTVFTDAHDFAVTHRKPMVVPEYGSNEDPRVPGRKGVWFTDAGVTIESWPELKMVSYFNNGPPGNDCPWFVDSSPTALAGFQALGADPYLNPPPPLVMIDSAPADLSQSTSATFKFSTNTLGSTFTCKLDAGATAPCTSPKTYSNLAQGDHTFTVFNTDVLGNTGQALDTWTVDTVGPTVTINSGPKDPTTEKTATFKFSANEGSVTYTCQLDSKPPATCTSPKVYSNLARGTHTFSVYGTDEAGNKGATDNWTWTIN